MNADLDPVQQFGYEEKNTSQAFKPSRLRRRQRRRREKQKLVDPTQCDQDLSQPDDTDKLGQDVKRATTFTSEATQYQDSTTDVIVLT